jgi:hypothetical protein
MVNHNVFLHFAPTTNTVSFSQRCCVSIDSKKKGDYIIIQPSQGVMQTVTP